MFNIFQIGQCKGCLHYKNENRKLLKHIENFKREIDKITKGDRHPKNGYLMMLSLKMEIILKGIKGDKR